MIAFAILLVVHGLIHLLGTAKAFGWMELPQLAHANASRGFTISRSACTAASAAVATDDGCHCLPSSTTSSIRPRACST